MITNRRVLIAKCLVACVAIYLCASYFTNNNSASNFIRELQQSGRNLASLDSQQTAQQVQPAQTQVQQQPQPQQSQPPQESHQLNVLESISFAVKNGDIPMPAAETEPNSPMFAPETTSTRQSVVISTTREAEVDVQERVKQITQCLDKPLVSKTQQRGDYWVLYNYVQAEQQFKCHESVTYTTHADYSFLDNLVPLIKRWKGPISIALHAPGSDFKATLDSVQYLRECTTDLIKQLVTFHVYFSTKHVPKQVPRSEKLFKEPYNCSLSAPYLNVSSEHMYKAQKKLLYPVNVGRNVARETSQTHFILASDIELYPSPNIIPLFLGMIAENKGPLLRKNPKVFPLHLFEVSTNVQVPRNKTLLQQLLKNGTALPFHKKLCPGCHNVPKSKEWVVANETEGLHVFHIGKRTGYFIHWEPIFIGTNAEPLYDERLSWEGKSDKMTQGYALCVLDYDFLILDNAFLVHKPGIKVYKRDPKRAVLAVKTNQLIKKIIFPELKVLYGVKKGCAV